MNLWWSIRTRGTGKSTSLPGRLGMLLFFLVFLGMGLLFTGFTILGAVQAVQMRSWPQAPATVTDSGVHDDGDYVVKVRFAYEYAGARREAEVAPAKFDSFTKAEQFANRYPVGTTVPCFVNPREPGKAVLKRTSLWVGLVVFFPLIFVGIGAGGLYWIWRKERPAAAKPISAAARPAELGRRGVLVLFAVFTIVGGVGVYFLAWRPLHQIRQARAWPATPCIVESSRVRSHAGDESTTYSVDILYRYEFNGRTHRSNRYDFMSGSSSGYDGKADVVRQYPPGKQAICYVNPADPTKAVLERGFTPMMYVGFVPVLFLLVGAGGLVYAARGGLQPKPVVPATTALSGPVVWKPKYSRGLKLAGITFAAVFWNGIVSVFVNEAIGGWRRGHPDYFLTVFMVPFVLVGIALIGAIGYFLLALVSPRPRLTVSNTSVRRGGEVELSWELRGRIGALRRLQIYLEGREEATYPSGDSSSTDKEVFATVPIVDETHPLAMASGRVRVPVPPDAMHSFRADHNKVLWHVHVKGEIPWRPDIKEEFELTVLP